MLSFHRLRLLRELQMRGTILAVAEALSYTPSAISQQLTILRKEAGVDLLEQTGRRVRLTQAGEVLCDHALTMLSQLERAEADLARSRLSVTGTLRAAAFQTATLVLIPQVLDLLASRFPDLQVKVSEIPPDGAVAALEAHDFDIIVGEEYPGVLLRRDGAVDRVDLTSDPMFLVSNERRPPGGLRQFAADPWVMEPVGNAARQWAIMQCREAGFEPDVRFESSDLLVHRRLAELGHAVALLPELLCRGDNLVQLHELDPPSARTIFSAVRTGSETRPDLRAFREALAVAYETSASSLG